MEQPLFSLAYTSVRSQKIHEVVGLWRSRARHKDQVEVVISVDGNREDTIQAAQSVPLATVVVQNDPPFNSVRGWNLACEHTTGKVIVVLSDDFTPPHGWDEQLLQLGPKGWIDSERVIHVNDGYVRDIVVIPIVTRKRYERFGYMYYPGYESIFCDTELTTVAYRDGVVTQASNLLFEHMHPDCKKRPRDSVDLVHGSDTRYATGRMLFDVRKNKGFPIDQGPKAGQQQEAPVKKDGPRYAMYMQANKDDFCLFEVLQRTYEEGIKDQFICVPDEYWSGELTKPEEIAQVEAAVKRMRERYQDVDIRVKIFKVMDYRFKGDSRIAVETRVRNDALSWVRQNGFEHIAVIDGDELWSRGTLDQIKELVSRTNCLTVSCPMVPVVGLPGYPVADAQDRVVVYMGASALFRDCRTPVVGRNDTRILGTKFVTHFTGTRRTMEEIVKKHTDSGHYDDPNYDFDNWLKNVLPNIKPGMENIHMYKHYQIWPRIRNWTKREYAEMPDSLHQYLAPPVDEPLHAPHAVRDTKGGLRAETPDPKATPFRKTRLDKVRGFSQNPFRANQ